MGSGVEFVMIFFISHTHPETPQPLSGLSARSSVERHTGHSPQPAAAVRVEPCFTNFSRIQKKAQISATQNLARRVTAFSVFSDPRRLYTDYTPTDRPGPRPRLTRTGQPSLYGFTGRRGPMPRPATDGPHETATRDTLSCVR